MTDTDSASPRTSPQTSMRLSKRLIELIGCSRREADLYIEGGWVLVDGQTVEEPQFQITTQQVALHPEAVLAEPQLMTLLWHFAPPQQDGAGKEQSSLPDPANRWPDDASGIRPLKSHFARQKLFAPLQANATGLRVSTQDWRIERKLTDDLARLEQEYVVEVSGTLSAAELQRLNQPVSCRGALLPVAKVSWQNETRLRFALKNPQPGQIAFMCESAGLAVVSMKRIRLGAVPMSKMLPGQWRYLAAKERF